MNSNTINTEQEFCRNCQVLNREHTRDVQNKCEKWLEKLTISSNESVTNSESSSEVTTASTEDDQNAELFCNKTTVELPCKSLNIHHSQDVNVGNVTNIYGPVYLAESFSMINHHKITNQINVNLPPPETIGSLSFISREKWKALPPMKDPTLLNAPAKFVIICHTVSEPDENTQLSNTRLLQAIQKYHVTKRDFDDISYNFLIGTDANVYEGRGWMNQGAFAKKYNKISIGISFVGYYEEKLPSQESLEQAKMLIQRGVEIGAIEADYSLLAHCQSSPTDSPGERLYFEIRRWDKWNKSIDVQHPSQFIS